METVNGFLGVWMTIKSSSCTGYGEHQQHREKNREAEKEMEVEGENRRGIGGYLMGVDLITLCYIIYIFNYIY